MKNITTISLIAFISACAPVMEVMRPDPIDISQFTVGESKMKVVSDIGAPISSMKEGKNSCDIYKLYTKGLDGMGKGVIAAGEAVGDVLTLGLTEVLFTPAEAATKNAKHTVIFCYTPDDKIASVTQSDVSMDK